MLGEIAGSFSIGLLTPLTALCVLPLYPAFLSYLSGQLNQDTDRKTYALMGLTVVSGVMSFMLLLGLVFSTLLQSSLTSVIQMLSPFAFVVLAFASIGMILDLDFSRYLPTGKAPRFDNPLANAFGFGFFFGAIIVPCNPAFIAAFFARAFLFSSPFSSILNFAAFGSGIGMPLMLFSVLSSSHSKKVIGFLKDNETVIRRGSGVLMLGVSLYYLFFVFGPL